MTRTQALSVARCEENYARSPYIAEFINTITNLPVILAGFYGAYATVAGGVRRRYALLYLGLSLIGIGSFGFHASLRWEWQLMDELPMVSPGLTCVGSVEPIPMALGADMFTDLRCFLCYLSHLGHFPDVRVSSRDLWTAACHCLVCLCHAVVVRPISSTSSRC